MFEKLCGHWEALPGRDDGTPSGPSGTPEEQVIEKDQGSIANRKWKVKLADKTERAVAAGLIKGKRCTLAGGFAPAVATSADIRPRRV